MLEVGAMSVDIARNDFFLTLKVRGRRTGEEDTPQARQTMRITPRVESSQMMFCSYFSLCLSVSRSLPLSLSPFTSNIDPSNTSSTQPFPVGLIIIMIVGCILIASIIFSAVILEDKMALTKTKKFVSH